jgi:hypothetical protein
MKKRMAALILGIVTGIGVVLGVGIPAAHAASSYETCNYYENSLYVLVPLSPCLNAWNGGPDLNAYSPGASHEDFELVGVYRSPNLYYQIEYLPDGTCVGDGDGGSPSDARAVMNDTCNGSNGYGGSYGTLFNLEYGCPDGGWAYENVHWNGLLGAGTADGSAFYLNTSGVCLNQFTL